MFFKKKSLEVTNKAEMPKTEKELHHARLVNEAWWLFLLLIGLYLAVILVSFDAEDPSWFFASSNDVVQNMGGKVGASISSLLLHLFGYSAWWWVVLAFYTIWLTYHQIEAKEKERPLLLFNLVGFAILILASSALEAGHIANVMQIFPDGSGRILGQSLDELLRGMFAYAGTTMILLLMFAIGFSLFTGWSWVMMTEKLGAGLINVYDWAWNKYNDWQDRKVGKALEQERSEYV